MVYCWSVLTLWGVLVVIVGAFTRLVDAGLGCPDWPTCFGYWSLTAAQLNAEQAQQFYQVVFDFSKAWPEMYHRYIAGVFALGIAISAIFLEKRSIGLRISLIALLIFQAVLGMWTVTWKLHPVVVMLHLLGGMSLTGLCCWMALKHSKLAVHQQCSLRIPFLCLGFCLIMQILLGGWTSSNYASIVCQNFPTCLSSTQPSLDWFGAFDLWLPIGNNYEGGHMDFSARAAVHMLHRAFACIVLIFLGWTTIVWYRSTQSELSLVLVAMWVMAAVQVLLGILNVLGGLPLFIAVAHNLGALTLFLLWVIGSYRYDVFTKGT